MAIRLSDLNRLWRDVWPALIILIPGLAGTHGAGENQLEWSREPGLFAYALVVLAAAAAVMLRRKPGVGFVGGGAALVTYLAADYPFGPILVTLPVISLAVAEAWPLRRTLVWNGGLWLAAHVAGAIRFGTDLSRTGDDLAYFGWLGVSFALVAVPAAIGAAVRIRRESDAGVRAAQARRAVSEERLRMAQELHDSVGHGLAVIAMQAGVALHVLDRNPAKARETLEAIRDASKESLDSLRAELQLLRTPDGEVAPRRPGFGLADADVLFDRIRSGGVEVAAEVKAPALPPDIDVAAYHILQESLTNSLRHSNATAVRVRVVRDGDAVVVEITDNGTGRAAEPVSEVQGGMGIPGMRARAETLGGVLSAGPQPGGGFAVRARLPLRVTAGEQAGVPGSAS